MRALLCALVAASSGVAGPDEERRPELALEGSWRIVSIERDGKKAETPKDRPITVEFRAGKYTLPDNLGFTRSREGTYKLDARAKPPRLDLVPADGPEKGKTFPGIYKLEKDRLTACYDATAGAAPDDFTAGEGSGRVLLVYERRKDGASLDLPAGTERVELRAFDKDGRLLAVRELPYPFEGSPLVGGQQPSPMVEHTRPHPRLKEERPAGRREALTVGTLFVPEGVGGAGPVRVFVHFHGPAWIAERAAAASGMAVIAVQLGTGSGVYRKAFAGPGTLDGLLKEAGAKAGVRFGAVGLTAWSAGYGAVREVLRPADSAGRVSFVVLLDALHAGYSDGKPGPRESRL